MRFYLDTSEDQWEGWEYKHEFCVDNPTLDLDMDQIECFMTVAVQWCIEQFGPSDLWLDGDHQGTDDQRWYYSREQIWFVRDEDAFAFRLRWC